MSTNIAKSGFLAILTFVAFTVPLILVDEVSLLANWLFIFISWSIVILLAALQPSKNKAPTSEAPDETPEE